MAQAQHVADDLGACPAHNVPGWLLIAHGVDEMTGPQAEDRAVGEELV
jgi:hypothetical protein